MASRYEVERALAEQAARDGDALAATVHWSLAARNADDQRGYVAALAAVRDSAEVAFHQGVHAANRAGWGWRNLAEPTGVPWQTLHRRYGRKPARLGPSARALLGDRELPQ